MSGASRVTSKNNEFGKLENTNTGTFETAVVNTEYLSPEQHGSVFGGIIYRRYYAIPDSPGAGQVVNIPLGFTVTGRIVNLTGVAFSISNSWLPLPYVDFGGSSRNIEFTIAGTNVVMTGGTSQDWQTGGFIWVDYTK